MFVPSKLNQFASKENQDKSYQDIEPEHNFWGNKA